MIESILKTFREKHQEDLNGLSEKGLMEFDSIIKHAINEELSEEAEVLWLPYGICNYEPSTDVLKVLRKLGINFVSGQYGQYFRWHRFITNC